MRKGEYGVRYVLGTSFNMASNTALSLVFTKPDGTTLTKTNPNVTIANTPYAPTTTPSLGTFAANTYFLYTFVNGDVDQSGDWTVHGIYSASGVHLISDEAPFTVDP